jgi:chromosome segregation ATPase
MREEVDKLFQEKVVATGRAQQMETRATQAEESLRELQHAMHQERERSRDLNLSGKLATLEAAAGTAHARYELLQASLQEKNDLVAEQQSQITDLEAELRQIQQRHEAEKLRIQLDFARKLGAAH